jgi:hypothetical protein
VVLALYFGMDRGPAQDDLAVGSTTAATAATDGSAAAAVTVAATTAPTEPDAGGGAPTIAPADVRITTIRAWDPDGDNGTENDTQAGLALADGSASTSWPTECYSNKFLSGKRGVGLVISLSGPSTGTLHVDSLNAPYQIDVMSSSEPTAPTEIDAWQHVGETSFADQPGSVEVHVDEAATFVLVWLKELGRDEACTEHNPFRGRLGEVSFTP